VSGCEKLERLQTALNIKITKKPDFTAQKAHERGKFPAKREKPSKTPV
jgi:hypothetical protein